MDLGLAEQLDTSTGTPALAVTPPAAPAAAGDDWPITRLGAMLKRSEDLLLGTLLILVISWLLLAIAVAIKLTSRGPVLFLQERRGLNGTIFRCCKFRTMYHAQTDYACTEQTQLNDPRVTPLGQWLRRHSLDELPQLFNVMIGHMALVGPRPHALGTNLNGRLLHEISDNYYSRYRMRPGITGWAQVNGWRGILDTEEKLNERLAHDLYYISHWSFWLDCKILLRTFTCLFDNDHAF
jgi:lipopolysaccharide/colanic/teichoic acid biosynthesis glycosyltransferase